MTFIAKLCIQHIASDCPWKLTPERQPHGWQVDHFCWEHVVDAKRSMFCCCFYLVVGLWSIDGHRESFADHHLPIGGKAMSSVKDNLIQHPLLVEIYHSITATASCVCSGDISLYLRNLVPQHQDCVEFLSLGY